MIEANAVLLAGGKSTRFGDDKALIYFQNRPLIEYIYSKLNSFFEKVIIIANNGEYDFLEGAVIKKDIIENKGPLAGIYSGLYYSDKKYNFVVGCDMPFIKEEYFSYLMEKIEEEKPDVLAAEKNGYIEPLAAVYSRDVLPLIKEKIDEDKLRLKSFYDQCTVEVIKEAELRKNFDLERLFFNINYPEDKMKAEKLLRENMVKADKWRGESEKI